MNETILDLLKQNWNLAPEDPRCKAYLKIDGLGGDSAFFMFAVDPADEKQVKVLERKNGAVEIVQLHENDLWGMYNFEGEFVDMNPDFRPAQIMKIIKNPGRY